MWRVIDSGCCDGATNMAIDEAILKGNEAGLSPPTIRIYRWNPACVSLGYSQSAEAEIDFHKLDRKGFDWTYRLTGGAAVLHIEELTYSVIATKHSSPWCARAKATYEAISSALTEALGIEQLRSESRDPVLQKPVASFAAPPCFAQTSRSEIVFGGKKLVGSAQRRKRDSFLQHGSILFSQRHLEIAEVLRLDADSAARFSRELQERSVSLDQVLPRFKRDEIQTSFLRKFANALVERWELGSLNPFEIQEVERMGSIRSPIVGEKR